MAHVKAFHLVYACTRSWLTGTDRCPYESDMSIGASDSCEDNCRGYVSEELVEETEDGCVISSFCKYLEVERYYLERNYKSISAEPLDSYYVLHAGPTTYLCEFLEIDGMVLCDNRESEVS